MVVLFLSLVQLKGPVVVIDVVIVVVIVVIIVVNIVVVVTTYLLFCTIHYTYISSICSAINTLHHRFYVHPHTRTCMYEGRSKGFRTIYSLETVRSSNQSCLSV